MAVVAIELELEIIPKLPNSATFEDLELPSFKVRPVFQQQLMWEMCYKW